jgi:hypothetical protein
VESDSLTAVKVARSRILVGLLLVVSIPARPQSPIANHSALTDRGRVEGLTYSNATLGFSYQIPLGFFSNPLTGNLPPGSLLLMIADTHNGTPWCDRIVLIADDARKYSWTTSKYVTHLVRSMPASLNIVMLRDTYLINVSGQEFFGADYQKTDEGKTVYQTIISTQLKGYFVSWTFTSLDRKRLGELTTSVNAIVLGSSSSKAR